MLELFRGNRILKGTDNIFRIAFTRSPSDSASMLDAVIAVHFSVEGMELTGWRLTTASSLVRLENTESVQRVEGSFSRSRTDATSHNTKVSYWVTIEYGGRVRGEPIDSQGFFHVIDPVA